MDELVQEVEREGFGWVLPITRPGARFTTLQEKALALQYHARNVGKWLNGDDLSTPPQRGKEDMMRPPVRAAAILAVMLYTGTDTFSEFNEDKRLFYNRSTQGERVPRFPVMDKLLMEARFCLSPVGNAPDEGQPEEVLWCGMVNAYLSKEDRERGQLRLAQDTSFSRWEEVSRSFMTDDSYRPLPGTIFRVTAKVHDRNPRADAYVQQDQMFFGDVSWISKFPDEEETLVEAGMQINIQSIVVESTEPYVEFVEGVLSVGIHKILYA